MIINIKYIQRIYYSTKNIVNIDSFYHYNICHFIIFDDSRKNVCREGSTSLPNNYQLQHTTKNIKYSTESVCLYISYSYCFEQIGTLSLVLETCGKTLSLVFIHVEKLI